MSMNTVSVDRELLEHCLSVMRGVGELCQPIPRKSEDDPTEYCGGQALAELANCYNRLQETVAYAEQVALPQAEQPGPCVNCRGSGITPIGDGYSVDACPQCTPEQPEAGRGVCSRCHGVDGDCDALMSDDPTACPCRCHEPQAQEAVRAAGLYPLYNELIDLIGECAVTDEMSCGVCRAEEGDDHHDSCPIGIIEEWAHNNLARESPPASAEAVRLLRKVWHCRTGYGTDVCEMLAEDDYDDLCAEVETFLAQHGGRGDE